MVELVSIIIPFFNRWDLVHARMAELYRYTPPNCEILLVNDASTDVEIMGGEGFWQRNSKHKVRIIVNKINVGFGQSSNVGVKKASGTIVIVLSNDVVIRGDFVTEVVTKLQKDEKLLVGARIISWPAGWNEFTHEGKPFIVPYVEGWMVACTKDAWEEIGGFDPRYGKFDVEDQDLSLTALSLGYNLAMIRPGLLQHIGGATIGTIINPKDRMDITVKNTEKYVQKWSPRFGELFERVEKAYAKH